MTLTDSMRIAYRLFQLQRSQWWSGARIRRYQNDALIKTLRHAIATVPYYRSLGLNPREILSSDDLGKFPVLTKRDVQELGGELVSADYDKSGLSHSMTSGTSGEPTTTYFDNDCWLLSKFGLKIRRMISNGLGPFKRIVVISEQTPDQLRHSERLFGSSILFDQRSLSIHSPVSSHLATLRERRIDALYAFPSYLAELLDYCEANQIAPPQIPVVFTSSEVLQDGLRSRIELGFGGRVCDVYGSTEFKEIAWQCAQGTYHVNFESVYLESAGNGVIDEDGGENVLVTSLTNRAMPLIRYRIGDDCALDEMSCACGRRSPTLTVLGGRQVDMVRLPEGGRVSPYLLTTAVESHSEIAKYQIVQLAKADMELCYVPKRAGLSASDVRSIQVALREHLGSSMTVRVTAVSEIPRTVAGKHRVFVQAMGS